ncbi:MAG: dTDP-4-dehydrorhamnose 3,5-epimerase [Bacteroidia bacterium]|nr:dTDP-4-dehydrorhamnose 3,5-epimerase [Bacteroidota bacterium]MBP6638985.1 dTDP-4-dehydrorhamnose 3,5-epimerase [Bacteroidia bacterium]
MGFKLQTTDIEGLLILEPAVFGDERGYFMETYSEKAFAEIGLDMHFVQDNLSYSRKGILRGLHFQAPPSAQGKLVSVVKGHVLDVAVDIRKGSPTYGKHAMVHLSDENHKLFYIPPGFAHGFLVISEECYFSYKCTGTYDRGAEGGLMWNDPALGIDWQASNPVISEKDTHYKPFGEFESPF